jgi:nucleoside-diphosphate-sugar epimerase
VKPSLARSHKRPDQYVTAFRHTPGKSYPSPELPDIDRVYANHRAQEELGWRPRFDFRHVLDRLQRDENVFSTLARAVGSKGYHPRGFEDGPYPIESTG